MKGGDDVDVEGFDFGVDVEKFAGSSLREYRLEAA